MMMPHVLDQRKVMICLCAGYSGESIVMREETESWVVYRIDLNEAVCRDNPGTLCLDVLAWLDWIETMPKQPEIVWASPPCTQFSTARAVKIGEPELDLMNACMDIIEHLDPVWWIIENVRGAVQHFGPRLGPPTQVIGPFYLWGKFPHLDIHVEYKGHVRTRINRDVVVKADQDGHWRFNGKRFNKWDTPQNAEIPRVISQELLTAVNTQRTLDDFL